MTYYLYIKKHNKTGLKYLGQTSSSDPYDYTGSGKRWISHLKKHGKDFSTEMLIETEDKTVIKENGIYYSELYNVVESEEWANLKIEEGDGGWSTWNKSPEAKSSREKGGKKSGGGIKSTSFKKGDPRVKELSKKANEIKANKIKKNPDIYKESYRKISAHQKENNSMKDMCWCIKTDEDDYSNRKTFKKDKIPEGWIRITEHRENKKDKSNSAYGKMWIYNPNLKENKYIEKTQHIPNGWYKGRKMEYYKV